MYHNYAWLSKETQEKLYDSLHGGGNRDM